MVFAPGECLSSATGMSHVCYLSVDHTAVTDVGGEKGM